MDLNIIHKNENQLGEAPIWYPKDNSFYWLDYLKNKLHSFNIVSKKIKSFDLNFKLPLGGLVAFNNNGKFLIGCAAGIYSYDILNNKTLFFCDPEQRNIKTIYNDLKIDKNKCLWVSTSHIEELEKEGSLWKVNEDLTSIKVDSGFKVSNGPAFSPDNNFIYFSDTFQRRILRYEKKDNGISYVSNNFHEFDENDGYPDGLTVDSKGNIFVAHWGGGKISVLNKKSIIIDEIHLPAKNVTSLCFGGSDMKKIFVTSAKEDTTKNDLKKFKFSGSCFLIDSEYKGKPENFYSD